MISKSKLFSIFFFFVLLLPVYAENKITFLNLDLVLSQSNPGQLILNDLENLKKKNEESFQNLGDKIKKKEQDLLKKKNILSKEEFEASLISLKSEIDLFNKERSKTINEYEQFKKKKLNEFLSKITPLIREYTSENSISLVLNQKDIFIGNKNYDITNDIVKIIDNNIK